MSKPLLSIVIPTYNRCDVLLKGLDLLDAQMSGVGSMVEVIVKDDCSTDETQRLISRKEYSNFDFEYSRNLTNIGLERNLIEAGRHARGQYLWIFGDDDRIESSEGLHEVIKTIKETNCDICILNRTRKNITFDRVLSSDWMGIAGSPDITYAGMRNFFLRWGFISVAGFISVNIFKRELFYKAFNKRFFGTMYPQLGMMASAFADGKVILKSMPIVCHRTLTSDEKAASFKTKTLEKTFMSDVPMRDAMYFGAPLIEMMNVLAEQKALSYSDIDSIKENTVINGRIVDFIFNNISSYMTRVGDYSEVEIVNINKFFTHVTLEPHQIEFLRRAEIL